MEVVHDGILSAPKEGAAIMSTKNLARTVMEGGRAPSSAFERREATRSERHLARASLNMVRSAEEWDEIERPLPLRNRPWKEFADKLMPTKRWLRSHVGLSWDDVRSKLTRRYDRRILKNWHLLDVHLLRDVEPFGRQAERYAAFRTWGLYEDENGILCDRPRSTRRHVSKTSEEKKDVARRRARTKKWQSALRSVTAEIKLHEHNLGILSNRMRPAHLRTLDERARELAVRIKEINDSSDQPSRAGHFLLYLLSLLAS